MLAIEHNDGTASMARAPSGAWLPYAGLGDKAAQATKTRYRVDELRAAYALLQRLQAGNDASGALAIPSSRVQQQGKDAQNGPGQSLQAAESERADGGFQAYASGPGPGPGSDKSAAAAGAAGGARGGSLAALLPALAQRFGGRLDLTRLALCGHSYGGMTAAGGAAELPWAKVALTLDPWW